MANNDLRSEGDRGHTREPSLLVPTVRLSPGAVARMSATPASPSLRGLHMRRFLTALPRSIWIALVPYTDVIPPSFTQADFPELLPHEVHELLTAALAQEDQRTSRLDQKASSFLSTAGILIPLITTVLTFHECRWLRISFFVAVVLATLSGVAAFRALQVKRGQQKLSSFVAIDGSGVIRSDTKQRHTIALLYVLKTDEAVNDHRAKLIAAASTLLAVSTAVVFFAAVGFIL